MYEMKDNYIFENMSNSIKIVSIFRYNYSLKVINI